MIIAYMGHFTATGTGDDHGYLSQVYSAGFHGTVVLWGCLIIL